MLPKESNCCSCLACMDICKVGAITTKVDKEGFIYPEINIEKCVKCGLCERICPVLNSKQKENSKIKKIYAGYIRNEEKLNKSASGGIATAISEYFIKNGGIVIGVEYTKDFKNVEYTIIDNEEDLDKIKSSKYIQSNKNSIYKKVKQKLNDNINVLFIGLPCEIAGLKNFLMKDYSNLYTCALICMGPTSQKVEKEYIEHFEKKRKSKVKSFNLRSKVNGWGPPNHIKIEFENGKEYIKPFNETEYGNAFQILSKPSCLNCKFKIDNTYADISIGDYWGIEKDSKIYNKKGVSIIFVHNCKMDKMINSLNELIKIEIGYEEAIKNNEMIINSRKLDKRRTKYSKKFIKSGLFRANKSVDAWYKKIIPNRIKTKIKKQMGGIV